MAVAPPPPSRRFRVAFESQAIHGPAGESLCAWGSGRGPHDKSRRGPVAFGPGMPALRPLSQTHTASHARGRHPASHTVSDAPIFPLACSDRPRPGGPRVSPTSAPLLAPSMNSEQPEEAKGRCLESLPIVLSDLVRDHTWAGTVAPRRLRAGARTAGLGRRYHRRPGAIRVTDPTLRRVHSHAHESRSATGTE